MLKTGIGRDDTGNKSEFSIQYGRVQYLFMT
jgi:hypothetical protein